MRRALACRRSAACGVVVRRALLCTLLGAATAARASAQCVPPLLPPDAAPVCSEKYPSWTGELASFGANTLLGGISAGVIHKLKHGSFKDAFVRGAAGGAVIYGGKRIAVERFGGAGLVGREVAALGGSLVRNAGEGRGLLELVALPVGPAWLYVQRGTPRLRLRLDVTSTAWLLYAIQESELAFDAASSLSAGAPVFNTHNRIIFARDDTSHAGGITEPGIIFLSDVPAFGRDFARRTFEHERIHVLQMDQIFLTMTDPVEDAALQRIPYAQRLAPYIDLNLSGPLLGLLAGRIATYLDRPWETEAVFFSR